MIRDRGVIKWTSMMLPEHVQELKKALADEDKVEKPEMDEQSLEEFEMIIAAAMAFSLPIFIDIFENGKIRSLNGIVVHVNYQKSQLVIKDNQDSFHHIPFNKLTNVHSD